MPKTIAIVNQKGGVGKTTTSINLAAVFAAVGKKTLIIDLDPQGNASTGIGINREERKKTIYDAFINQNIDKSVIKNTFIPLLSIITSNVDLSAAEIELIGMESREYILKDMLQNLEYDFIIIDCPPSLSLLTINALVAADSVIIPSQCEFFALEGLSHLLKTISLVKNNLNKNLSIDGIILTMHDKQNKLSEQVETDVRKYLRDKVFKTVIPRNVKLSVASSHGKPAIIYDVKCAGAKSYLYLAQEILSNE
ncbi:MAG: ParA family protein [Rickettsiaceae bacterium H1]|nr:ParA family protein [Rickettsiaceae bacterium H1]